MFRFLIGAAALAPAAALACSEITDDDARLACFDQQAVVQDECLVEDWRATTRSGTPYITGAMTCQAGRIDYRLYDGDTEEFLTAGFTYFQGYSFGDYPNISAWPPSAVMKYSVDPG